MIISSVPKMSLATWCDLLECPACGAGALEPAADGAIRCRQCARVAAEEDGVYDFLVNIHPLVRKEIDAIGKNDSNDPDFIARFRRWLAALASGEDDFPPEDRASPFLRTALLHRREIRDVVSRYPIESGTTLVELGADHCWASGIFIDHGARVIAIDISDHLKLAPRRECAALLRLKADMNRIPVSDCSVDYVVANACAHHSWDLARTFHEAHRVLKPGGRFYLCSEPMPGILRYVLFKIFDSFGRRERDLGVNETLHRRSEWLRIAARSGFRPLLVFPRLSRADLRERLQRRRLPPRLDLAVAPLARFVQVSIHMIAEKGSEAAEASRGRE